MRAYKPSVFLLLLVLLGTLFSVSGLAAAPGDIGEALYSVFGFFAKIDLSKLAAGSADLRAVFYAKMILWILLFSILYYVSKFIFTKSPRIGGTVAATLSFLAILGIPSKVIGAIFQTYAVIFTFILYGIVLVGFFYASKGLKSLFGGSVRAYHFGAFVVYMLALYVVTNLFSNIEFMNAVPATSNLGSLTGWFGTFIAILWIFIIYHLAMALLSKGSGNNFGSNASVAGGIIKAGRDIKNYFGFEKSRERDLRDLSKSLTGLANRLSSLSSAKSEDAYNLRLQLLDSLKLKLSQLGKIVHDIQAVMAGQVSGQYDFAGLKNNFMSLVELVGKSMEGYLNNLKTSLDSTNPPNLEKINKQLTDSKVELEKEVSSIGGLLQNFHSSHIMQDVDLTLLQNIFTIKKSNLDKYASIFTNISNYETRLTQIMQNKENQEHNLIERSQKIQSFFSDSKNLTQEHNIQKVIENIDYLIGLEKSVHDLNTLLSQDDVRFILNIDKWIESEIKVEDNHNSLLRRVRKKYTSLLSKNTTVLNDPLSKNLLYIIYNDCKPFNEPYKTNLTNSFMELLGGDPIIIGSKRNDICNYLNKLRTSKESDVQKVKLLRAFILSLKKENDDLIDNARQFK